ncbi:hypothetical protein GJAV_G00098390 [Gymnothorax javanicus]|nr:hypothetical protein GJAV_G00098390 [Gymnothorax javanicus]
MAEVGHVFSTFMYFAYGSNLLKERLQLQNPSATFHSTGRLKDYNLNFGVWGESGRNDWHGGTATIEECIGNEVWGVIWKINQQDQASLDKQEGVNIGMYRPLVAKVETDEGIITCRTYQMNNFTASLPSPQYKQVICLGAKQNGLPSDYIRKLEALKTNNYSGPSVLDDVEKAMA